MTVLRPLFFSRGSLSARTERRGRRTLPQSCHAPQKAGAPVPFSPDSALFSKKGGVPPLPLARNEILWQNRPCCVGVCPRHPEGEGMRVLWKLLNAF